jgi:hypothetical protein
VALGTGAARVTKDASSGDSLLVVGLYIVDAVHLLEHLRQRMDGGTRRRLQEMAALHGANVGSSMHGRFGVCGSPDQSLHLQYLCSCRQAFAATN